jgi:RES domain-containing protein
VTFYRLSSLSRSTPAQAFSGEGALHGGGRWNSVGTRLVYTSASVALACLETLVHMRMLTRAGERWLFSIDVPDHLIDTLQKPPAGWDAEPTGTASQSVGDEWIAEQRGVVLLVPSVVVPMERNALINPRHPLFELAWVKKRTRFRYDPRLQ